jgi:aspartyl/asparaginyl beta-hydroxylase (cupin superfamily)
VQTARENLEARDPGTARSSLERAMGLRPGDLNARLLLAAACRMQGDHRAALEALNGALSLDPYAFVTHLSIGASLEGIGELHAAAKSYRSAVSLAPPKAKVPAPLRESMEHAVEFIQRDTERLHAFLVEATKDERASSPSEALRRFDECLSIFSGRSKRFVHEASLLYFPQLPALPFHDDAHFPWMPRLEAATEAIREELLTVMKEDWEAFHPYIQYPENAPVRQWKTLNFSPAWSAFELWRDGQRVEGNCRRCPRTTAILESLPLVDVPGLSPNAMFSVLAPHTHIPPHTGSTNVRLIVHLPLILPAGCRYRVGNDHREWKPGKAWVFDDTIEHEAWNDSDETRVILMFDVWNPLVTEAERALVKAMLLASRRYR